MMTNTFTDLNGNVTNLQDKLIEFAETSGDAIGILGDSIKTELCDNLSIALDYLEDYSKIFNELGFKQLGDINYRGNMKDGSVSKTLNTGDFIFNVDGNMDDKALNDMRNMIKQTLQDIVNALGTNMSSFFMEEDNNEKIVFKKTELGDFSGVVGAVFLDRKGED